MEKIKSKKAKSFIDVNMSMNRRTFAVADIEYCVVIAEQELDERYLEQIKQIEIRAVEAHKATCINMRCQGNTTFRNGFGNNKCSGNCEYVEQFTKRLNEK